MTTNPMAWEGSVNPKVCPCLREAYCFTFYYILSGLFSLEMSHIGRIIITCNMRSQVKTMVQAQDCLLPMGVTSENVAHRFGVTRQEQDQAAVS